MKHGIFFRQNKSDLLVKELYGMSVMGCVPAAFLEVEQNALKGEVEVADVQIVLSSSDPGNVFQALWKLLCSCSLSQSLSQQ